MGRLVPGPEGPRDAAEGAVVVIVRTLVTGEPLGVTDGGANEHCDKAGRPKQEKFTVWLKPPTGVTVKLKIALPPALTVALEGEAVIEKSGAMGLTCWETAGESELTKLESPL